MCDFQEIAKTFHVTVSKAYASFAGGALVFQAGYHPRKRTFKTHSEQEFSGVKIDPKYAFLHALCLICVSCPFQNLSI